MNATTRRLVLDLRPQDPPRARLQHGPVLEVVRQHPVALPRADDRRRDHARRRALHVAAQAAPKARAASCRARRDRSCCGPRRSRCRRSSVRSAGAPSSRTSTRTCRRSCTARSPPVPRSPRSPRAPAILWGTRTHPTLVVARRRRPSPRSRSRSRAAHWRWEPQQFIPTQADVAAGDRADQAHRRAARRGVDAVASLVPRARRQAAARPSHGHQGRDVAPEPRSSSASTRRCRSTGSARSCSTTATCSSSCRRSAQYYRPALKLPRERAAAPLHRRADRARLDLGARAAARTPPKGAKVVFDFESTTLGRLDEVGRARGATARSAESLPGQELVIGATGQRFATSMHGGDAATGRVTSPSFALDGAKLSLQARRRHRRDEAARRALGRWRDRRKSGGPPSLGGDVLRELVLGHQRSGAASSATLVLVDDATPPTVTSTSTTSGCRTSGRAASASPRCRSRALR